MINEFAKKIIASESVISFFNLATKPIAIANSFVIVGFLSIGDFGIYKLVLSFYALISGFSIDFLDNLILNEMSIFHGEKKDKKSRKIFKEYFFFKIFFGFLLTGGVFLFSNIISRHYGAEVSSWIKIISFLFIFDNVKSLLNIFFQFKLKFFISSSYLFFSEVVKILLILLIVKTIGLGISQLLFINVFTSFIMLIFLFIIFLRERNKDNNILSEDEKDYEEILLPGVMKIYGKWAFARHYILNFSQNIRPWIINYFLGTEAVAIFSIAYDFSGNLKSLVSLDSLKTIIPRELGDKEKTKNLFIRGSKYMTYLYIVFFFVGMTAVTILIKIFLSKYNQALPYFYIISSTMFIYGIYTLTGRILYSLRKQKELFLLPLINIISIVVFSILLIPIFGLYGASMEFVITQVAALVVSYLILIKYKPELKIKIEDILFLDNYDKEIFRSGYLIVKDKMKKFLKI